MKAMDKVFLTRETQAMFIYIISNGKKKFKDNSLRSLNIGRINSTNR